MRAHKATMRIGMVTVLLAMLMACGSGPGNKADGDGAPTGPVQFIVPFSAGGGPDLVARTAAKILSDDGIVHERFEIENVEGGNALVGMTQVASSSADDDVLLMTGPHIVTTPLLQESTITYENFTPLAIICTEYVYVFVRPDSPLKNAQDLADALRKDPDSLTVGGSVTGGPSNVAFMLFVKALGIDTADVTYIPYDGAEAVTALLGGQLDVATSGPDTLDMVKAGELRAIAVSSPEPLDGDSAGIQTFKEAGADTELLNWRIVSGPPGMSEAAVQYWQDAFTKMDSTEAWKKAMAENGWSPLFRTQDLPKYLAEENAKYIQILTELGILNGQ